LEVLGCEGEDEVGRARRKYRGVGRGVVDRLSSLVQNVKRVGSRNGET
jgi:hypothetical protein